MTSTDERFGRTERTTIQPTPDQLSNLIGEIYDCALDPTRWEAVLALICREFTFCSSMMGMARFPADPFVLASTGVDAALLNRLPELSAEMAALWGGWEQLQRFPLDEPIVNSQVMPRERARGNAYMAEWLSRGVADATVVMIARDTSMIGNVGFNRHGSDGPIGAGELDGLRLLAPHFRRAVKISDLFDMQRVEAATFSTTLDSFHFGIVLVDAQLGIVHANTMAARLLARRGSIQSVKGFLALPVRAAQDALERAVHHAARNPAQLGARGIGIPAQGEDSEASILHVLPLKQGSLRRGLGQRAAAAIFVAPAVTSHLPTDALALLFDLTPAEIRVFVSIVAGATPASTAKALGIASSTVKTHLIRIFQKTGCGRQSQLVKLANDLSLPI